MNYTRVLAVFAVAMMVMSVFAAAPAAAITAPTVTATDDGTGATTDHTVSTDYDNTDSPSLQEVEVQYTATDASDLSAEDVTVSVAGVDETVSSVDVTDDTTVRIVLETAVTLSDTDTVEVNLDGVTNPDNSGTYDVGVELFDDTGSSFDSAPGTDSLTITVGDTPSITGQSALNSSTEVADFNASDDRATTLEAEAHTNNLELRVTDGNDTYATFSDVTTVTEATDTSPGTYEIEMNHSDLDEVPMGVNENVTVTAEVHNLDATDATNNFEFNISNTDERSVAFVSSDSIDDADVGVGVTSSDVEVGGFLGFGAEDETVYDIEDSATVSGSNTTVTLHLADSDVADDYESTAEDRDAGDVLAQQALTLDGDIALVFNEEADEDIVDTDSDTYGVYDADSDTLTIELGEDFDDAESVDYHSSSQSVIELDDVETDEIAAVYGQAFGFTDLSSEFGVWTAVSSILTDLDDVDALYGVLFAFGSAASARTAYRQQTAA